MTSRAKKRKVGKKAKPQSVTIEHAFELAQQLHRSGLNTGNAQALVEAQTLYERILRAVPDHADALHYLGVLHHQTGRREQAAELIRKSLTIVADQASAWSNLGNVLKESGNLHDASDAYRKAIALSPQHANALSNLGTVLKVLGQLPEAVECYRRAIDADPNHVGAHQNLGNALQNLGQRQEAIGCYRRAVELNPSQPDARKFLGLALHHDGQCKEVIEVFEAWAKSEPGNPVAAHMLAACSGNNVPSRASDAYVQKAFDDLAGSFDEHLAELGYRAPAIVAAEVARVAKADSALDVLDAGCGTGLCGPLLRAHARTLVGVDLSPGMLARARQLRVYDELRQEELTAYVASRPGAWDLIVSADTLCYFGDLAPVIAACFRALRTGGWLIFTVEQSSRLEPGFHLQPHGRYSHAEPYLTRGLVESGFEEVSLKSETLRLERGKPVAGFVVVARRARDGFGPVFVDNGVDGG